jgi:DNA polymerase I-like protein with 3'-5' exonuclease and polymerase domains
VERYDRVGMWWQDYPQARTKATYGPVYRVVAPPPTGWTPPKELPNLAGVRTLGLDTETKDTWLTEHGSPGAVRGQAYVVGVSVATSDAAWYLPIRHEYEAQRGMNLDPGAVLKWLKDLLAQPQLEVVGAKLLYDLEVLRAEGIEVAGPMWDVQFAQPLLDEHQRWYNLDALGNQHLGVGKGKDYKTLYQWCADSFGGAADGHQRANIYRAPPTLVGPYAESDARTALQVLDKQRVLLAAEDLTELFAVECGLIPLLLDMRFRGVRIDLERAQQAATWLRAQAKAAQDKLPGVDVWSGASLARAFDAAGVKYPYTEAGNPSFTKQWLESVSDHPLPAAVLDIRMYEKAANPFVESYLLGNVHNGRVHCQFHPLRSDDYGAVSGRFSSSDPNLQNIPVRHKVIGPLLRGLFIPEPGCGWRREDYDQVEYRALVHYARGRGADLLRQRYRDDPTTDFHKLTTQLVQDIAGVALDRRPAKNLNFGLVYGMGKDKLKRSLGVSEDLAERLYEAYFQAMPAVKVTYNEADRIARRRGYVLTHLKRRRRFAERESTHKALNAVLQGTAADIMKKAMHDIYKAGLTKVLGAPHLTVHDELDWSDPQTKESAEAFAEVERIMVDCVQLRVPLRVSVGTGKNWAEAT